MLTPKGLPHAWRCTPEGHSAEPCLDPPAYQFGCIYVSHVVLDRHMQTARKACYLVQQCEHFQNSCFAVCTHTLLPVLHLVPAAQTFPGTQTVAQKQRHMPERLTVQPAQHCCCWTAHLPSTVRACLVCSWQCFLAAPPEACQCRFESTKHSPLSSVSMHIQLDCAFSTSGMKAQSPSTA